MGNPLQDRLNRLNKFNSSRLTPLQVMIDKSTYRNANFGSTQIEAPKDNFVKPQNLYRP